MILGGHFVVSVIFFYRPKFSVICFYRFNSKIRTFTDLIITDLIPIAGPNNSPKQFFRFGNPLPISKYSPEELIRSVIFPVAMVLPYFPVSVSAMN